MGRGRPGIIQRYGEEVIKDLEKTTLPLAILGEKYGVTKQALSQFVKKEGIRREPAPRKKGHAVDQCSICKSILRISKIPHGEFLTGRTIRERLRPSVRYERYRRHIRILKEERLMHQMFGCLASKKSEKAYAMSFTMKVSVYEIGMMAGLRNFHAMIRQQGEWGWMVHHRFSFTGEGDGS